MEWPTALAATNTDHCLWQQSCPEANTNLNFGIKNLLH